MVTSHIHVIKLLNDFQSKHDLCHARCHNKTSQVHCIPLTDHSYQHFPLLYKIHSSLALAGHTFARIIPDTMSKFYSILLLMGLSACKTISLSPRLYPAEIQVESPSMSVVIVDAGDVYTPGLALTKKREAVVTQIKELYLSQLPEAFKRDLQLISFRDTTLSAEEQTKLLQNDPQVKMKLREKYKANLFVILRTYEGGFRQDDVVKKTNTDGSTNKTAYYSVFFETELTIIQGDRLYEKRVSASKEHSQRSVLSGLLARGPGYEANRKDIHAMAMQNAKHVTGIFRERYGYKNSRGEFVEKQ